MKLTDHEQWTIINALRVAAETYAADAKLTPGRIGQQFIRQQREAEQLMEKIEQDYGAGDSVDRAERALGVQ